MNRSRYESLTCKRYQFTALAQTISTPIYQIVKPVYGGIVIVWQTLSDRAISHLLLLDGDMTLDDIAGLLILLDEFTQSSIVRLEQWSAFLICHLASRLQQVAVQAIPVLEKRMARAVAF